MEAGQIKEVGSPAELILKPDGFFRGLVEETGDNNADAIRAIISRKQKGFSEASLPPMGPVSILSNKTSAARIDETPTTPAPGTE
jgi:hypothetical protein